jgi:DNA polymerase I
VVTGPIPIEVLLREAGTVGVQFGLFGAQVRVLRAGRLTSDLRSALRARRDEVWTHLGGAALDAAPLTLLHQLGVELCIPTTIGEAIAALARVEEDADRYTPVGLSRLVGLDLETAALPGSEKRPPTRLKRNGEPAKSQPAFKGTAALDPHRSRIRLVQVYGGGTHCVVLDLDRLPLDLVAPLFERRTVIVHNASFELRFLGAAGIAVPHYEDTMQAAGLLLGVRQRSLEDAAGVYLGIALTKHLQTSDWSAPQLSPGQYAYAAIDAIVAFRLWPKLHPELVQKGREVAYQLQRDVTRVAVGMVDRGIPLDRGRHQIQIDEWRSTLASATRAFQQEAGQLPPDTPAKTVEYLKKVLPPEVLENWPTTPKGAMSTKAANLRRHVVTVPAIRSLLDIRATQTLLNNFGDTLLSKISARTGRLHPGLNIGSAKSGRSSSNNPNVQQVPKHKSPAMRAAFVAAAGYRFICADYSMMELRAGAEVSNDQVMRQDFADGVDLHRRQAAAMLGISEEEVTADQRDMAKPVNFGTIYGDGPVGLAASAWNGYGILLTPDEAGAGRQHFLARYYTFARWMRDHRALRRGWPHRNRLLWSRHRSGMGSTEAGQWPQLSPR